MEPTKEKEILLRRHGFEVVSVNKHRKYKNPAGKIFIESRTPSDWRSEKNSLTQLKHVIAAPAPHSELLEEIRQNDEVDATLDAAKKTATGMSGAGKGKRSKGTGFTYYEDNQPEERTPEQLDQEQRARDRAKERADERRAAKEAARPLKEWNDQLASFRRQMKQVDSEHQKAYWFGVAITHVNAVRTGGIEIIRDGRKKGATLKQLRTLSDHVHIDLFTSPQKYLAMAEKQGYRVAPETLNLMHAWARQFAWTLLLEAGRLPAWWGSEIVDNTNDLVNAGTRRHLRVAAKYRNDWMGEQITRQLAKLRQPVVVTGTAAITTTVHAMDLSALDIEATCQEDIDEYLEALKQGRV